MDFDFSVILKSLPLLLAGAKLTLIITLAGIAGGMCIGILAGLGRIAGTAYLGDEPHGDFKKISVVIRYFSAGFIESIRGTPIIVQAMFLYFAFPMLLKMLPFVDHFRMEAITAAIITIMVNAGAYIAEIVRGATISVHKGLVEAGLSLGISRYQLIRYVIGPIALRRMIPPLGNQFIISLKDTSLFIVIGVGELTRQGQEIMASNFRALEIWLTVAIIYLIMTTTLATVLRQCENRMKIY
ncbi:MAG: ABC transporter permease subunit [Pseudomonadota bacterium]|nr:ABC transporter permease subunit [Pseudomonadota bacterium]